MPMQCGMISCIYLLVALYSVATIITLSFFQIFLGARANIGEIASTRDNDLCSSHADILSHFN